MKKILAIAYKNNPWLFIGVNLFGAAQAISEAAHMISLANFIDRLSEVISGNGDLQKLAAAVCWYGLALFFVQLSNSLFNYLLDQYLDSCKGVFFKEFHRALDLVEPLEFEKTEFLDSLQRIREGVENCGQFTLYLFGVVDLVLPYFLFTGTYFSFMDKKLLLCLLFAFVPACFSLFAQMKLYTKLQNTAAPLKRKYITYKRYLTDKHFFKETRSLGAFHFFESKAMKELQRFLKESLTCSRKSQGIGISVNLMTVLGYAAMLIMLIIRVLDGKITLGLFVAVYHSMGTFFSLMQNLIGGFGYGLMKIHAGVKEAVSFMGQERPIYAPGNSQNEQGIFLNKVSFRYPGAEKPILSEINLHIPKGQVVAVVGENGAGKSTLAKLLLGIYKPEKGTIHTNNFLMSAVFQDFSKYKLTLDENVRISQPDLKRDTCNVLNTTSLDKNLLARKNETILSRDFEGIELSGGQWQQVALARAQYREHEFIVLDEPTASIDPVKEDEIYQHFLKMAEGKTAVLITHRLGAARLAQRILVLKDGHIVQDGTHEALLGQEGVYAQMWRMQSESYDHTPKTTTG